MADTDPASLNVDIRIHGLDLHEGVCAFTNLPPGSTAAVRVSKPAIGGKRYEIDARGLSAKGARDLTTALLLFLEEIAGGGD